MKKVDWHLNYVECAICGSRMRRLGAHVNKHEMHISEYKEKYPEAPTACVNDLLKAKSRKSRGTPTLPSTKAFVDETSVECLMCGKRFQLLCSHVKRTHGVSMQDYRRLFPGEPVASLAVSRKKSEVGKRNAKATNAKMTKEEKSKKASKGLKKRWKDENYRKHQIAAMAKGRKQSEAFRESHAKQLEEVRKTPKFKKAVAAALSKTAKAMWQDPEKRKAQRERLSKLQTDRMHAGINKYVNHHTNRANCIHTTPSGTQITMRSSWETLFAQKCDEAGVTYEYEPGPFPYTHDGATKQYTPDFLLPESNTFVEIKPNYFIDAQARAKMSTMGDMGFNIILCSNEDYRSEFQTTLSLLEAPSA